MTVLRSWFVAVAVGAGCALAGCDGDEVTPAVDAGFDDAPDLDAGGPPIDAIDAPILFDTPPAIVRCLLSPQALFVPEGGAVTFSVALSTQPLGTTTALLQVVDPTVATAMPAALTFTETTWGTPQLVTVTGVQDVDSLNDMTSVRCTVETDVATLPVTVNDDDVQAIVVEPTTLSLVEGGAVSFRVRLASMPAGQTIVTIVSSDSSAVAVAPANLAFTPVNWNNAQAVTAVGVQDNDQLDENATIVLSSPQAGSRTVPVAVSDDD